MFHKLNVQCISCRSSKDGLFIQEIVVGWVNHRQSHVMLAVYSHLTPENFISSSRQSTVHVWIVKNS